MEVTYKFNNFEGKHWLFTIYPKNPEISDGV